MKSTGYKDRLGNDIKVGDTINCYLRFDAKGAPLGEPIPRVVKYYPDLNICGCEQDPFWDHVIDLNFLHCNSIIK